MSDIERLVGVDTINSAEFKILTIEQIRKRCLDELEVSTDPKDILLLK